MDGSVPGASRDRVKLEVLLEGTPLTVDVGEALFFLINRQIVEERHEQHAAGEGPASHTELARVPTTGTRSSEDHHRNDVVYKQLSDLSFSTIAIDANSCVKERFVVLQEVLSGSAQEGAFTGV